MEIRFRRIEYLSCKIDTNLRMGNKMEERERGKKKRNARPRTDNRRTTTTVSRYPVKEKFLIAIEYPSRVKNRNMEFNGVCQSDIFTRYKKLILNR